MNSQLDSTTDSMDGSQYTKVSHEEHVMIAPDTYVGSIDREEVETYVLNTTNSVNEDGSPNPSVKIVNKKIQIVPALYKIFDEVLVNAIDHWKRLLTHSADSNKPDVKHPVTEIKVTLNQETGEISVYNNGDGIDVVYLTEHEMYPPELIFGTLLTGTNYNQEEEKTVGGKNGYGSKLTNMFSTKFRVETVDAKRQLSFTQDYWDNMKERSTPKIKKSTRKPFTRITFTPDYSRFGVDILDADTFQLFQRRVYDIAAWTDKTVGIWLNDEKIPVNCFERYVDLYFGDKQSHPRVYQRLNDRWEIVATYNNDDTFGQVSFVNGIFTQRGGKHVDYIVDQIKDGLTEWIKKKRKVDVKPTSVKNQLFVFIKSTIVNPSFDSQTKDTLTTTRTKFGSTAEIDSKFIDRLAKTAIVDKIVAEMAYKNSKTLTKTDGKKKSKIVGIPKLCDANKAGCKDSRLCTLILTEGDSAKTTAVAGLSIVGRDHWGVFPLKGKLLNVKDVDSAKIAKNEEISNIKKILGLQNKKSYQDYAGYNADDSAGSDWPLRYGRILIMTDQDHDGSHIKGLVMNLFHAQWPSLLRKEFITSMATPIVKVTKGKTVKSFYTIADYETWKESTDSVKSWKVKYYKGLGTSSTSEAKDYFRELHVINYTFTEDDSDAGLNLAFDKKLASSRKLWLQKYNGQDVIDFNQDEVSYEDFVNRELIHFSYADCQRSIPDIRDGFKPSQRKIMYSCLKRKLRTEIKVAQLAGYVSETSSYHHGEQSLMGAIIALAQDFVGANNLNLLFPSGQFGSRLMGGKDSASPRYIFTRLCEVTRLIFREQDDGILYYLNDDGFTIEPDTYLPIIPMILINGTRGIGTGYSSSVPCYHPLQVIDVILARLRGDDEIHLEPWYRKFTGKIVESDGSYFTLGTYQMVKANQIIVTELPVGTWTQTYKEYLDSCVRDRANEKSKHQFLKSYEDHSTESKVNFKLTFVDPIVNHVKGKKTLAETIIDLLKLKTSSETNIRNMVLYDCEGRLQKFESADDIIDEYYPSRLFGYIERREMLLRRLREESNILVDRVKFIEGVLAGDIDLRNKPEEDVDSELDLYGLRRLVGEPPSYDYLVSMQMRSQTKERVEELRKRLADKQQELGILEGRLPTEIWESELVELRQFIVSDWEKEAKAVKADDKKSLVKTAGGRGRGSGKKGRGTKK